MAIDRSAFFRLAESGLEAVFPSNIYCISCGSIIDQSRPYALCDKCARQFRWAVGRTCVKCGKLLQEEYRHKRCYQCRESDYSFEKGWCCVEYGLYEKSCILQFKYGGASYIGRKLSDALYDRLKCEEYAPELILPVPMHRKKERKRGYNQAALMAKYLAKKMQAPCSARMLVRVRETGAMSRLSAQERQANIEGAFSLAAGFCDAVREKEILLIDDIYTTGSTADACSRVLLEAGAKSVCLLVFAAGANVRRPAEWEAENELQSGNGTQ